MRTFEFRLYPHKDQSRLLMACLAESRAMYNGMLETVKAQYEQDETFPSKYDLEAAFKGQGEHVPATTVQMLADRLSKSLKRFLAAKKHAIPGVGFPRFKKPNRWHSIQLRQYGKDGYLHEDKKHLIVCEAEPQTEHAPSECSHPDIGIDVGLKSFLTDSEGHTVPNPRFYRTSQKTLRRKQRTMGRRKKGSHRRRKAAKRTAQTHLKIERQRRDHQFKVAKQYTERYHHIAVEDLQVTNMVRNHHLSKSILDAAWSQFLAILEEKAARAGHQVIRVNPRFTTQACSHCGELMQKSLSVRTHMCTSCGYVADRDVNAAQNILSKAGAPPSGANVHQ